MAVNRGLLQQALTGKNGANAYDSDASILRDLQDAQGIQAMSLDSNNFGGGRAREAGLFAQLGTAAIGAYARSRAEQTLKEKEVAAQSAFASKYPEYADLASQLSPATREAFVLKDLTTRAGFSSESDPASVREYNFYKNLPENEQKNYLGLKRIDPVAAAYAREQAKYDYAAPIEKAKMEGKGEISDIDKRTIGQDQVNTTVDELIGSYQNLKNKGGVIDTSQSAGQNLVNRIRATDAGQALGNAFGTEEQSIRNQIKSQVPALINSIRSATGMSAKAMDSNTELQFYLKQATSEKVDIGTNLKALESIKKLYGKPSDKSRIINNSKNKPSLDSIFKQE